MASSPSSGENLEQANVRIVLVFSADRAKRSAFFHCHQAGGRILFVYKKMERSHVLPPPEETKLRRGMRSPFNRASLVSVLSLVCFTLMFSACGSTSRVRYDSPQEAFEKGKEKYDDEKYENAILFFQGAFDFGRTHQWAADAQLYLARSYR